MNVNNIYKSLFELLTSPHGAADSAMAMATTTTVRRESLLVARKEDCVAEIYAQWDVAGDLGPSESAEYELLKRGQEFGADVARVLPEGAVLLGGAALQRHYPEGVPRFSSDVQVLIPDFSAIGPLHEAVKRLGYRLRGGGQWSVPLREPLHRGFATYRYAMGEVVEGAISIEVQVAGVPIDAQRNVPFAELIDKALKLDGLACRGLDPNRQLIQLFAGFSANAEPITVRQIADVHQILKAREGRIDHAWLHRRVEQWSLWEGLNKMREAIVAKRLSTLLDWGELGRLVGISAERIAAASGGKAAGAKVKGKDVRSAPRNDRAGAFVKSAFDLFGGTRRNDLASRMARSPWLVSTVLNAGRRVCGVQVSSKSASTPQLLRIDGGLYLATGAGLILLSLVDLTDDARSDMFERIRAGSRPVVLARWTGASPPPREKREPRESRDQRGRHDGTVRGSRSAARASRG